MNTITKISIFIGAAILFLGIAFALVVRSSDQIIGEDSKFRKTVDKEASIPLTDAINRIKIDSEAQNIIFYESDNDEVTARLTGDIFHIGFGNKRDLKMKE